MNNTKGVGMYSELMEQLARDRMNELMAEAANERLIRDMAPGVPSMTRRLAWHAGNWMVGIGQSIQQSSAVKPKWALSLPETKSCCEN